MTHNVLILKWSFIQPGEQGKQKMLQWISIENRYNNFKASMQISPDLSSVSKARIITISLTLQQFRYKMGTLNAEARCRCGALVSAVAGGGGGHSPPTLVDLQSAPIYNLLSYILQPHTPPPTHPHPQHTHTFSVNGEPWNRGSRTKRLRCWKWQLEINWQIETILHRVVSNTLYLESS